MRRNALWFGVLGPAFGWLFELEAVYALSPSRAASRARCSRGIATRSPSRSRSSAGSARGMYAGLREALDERWPRWPDASASWPGRDGSPRRLLAGHRGHRHSPLLPGGPVTRRLLAHAPRPRPSPTRTRATRTRGSARCSRWTWEPVMGALVLSAALYAPGFRCCGGALAAATGCAGGRPALLGGALLGGRGPALAAGPAQRPALQRAHGAARDPHGGGRAAAGAGQALPPLPVGPARAHARRWARVRAAPRGRHLAHAHAPGGGAGAHGLVRWVWHAPFLFEAALESEWVHGVQHALFFSTAALFWWALIHGRYGRVGYGVAVLFVFATSVYTGVLGAMITFGRSVWYPVYAGPAGRVGRGCARGPAPRRAADVGARRRDPDAGGPRALPRLARRGPPAGRALAQRRPAPRASRSSAMRVWLLSTFLTLALAGCRERAEARPGRSPAATWSRGRGSCVRRAAAPAT